MFVDCGISFSFFGNANLPGLRYRDGRCPVAVALDDRGGPPVLAHRDLPDPSSCGHTLGCCPRSAKRSVPGVVCGTAGHGFISAWCVRGHGVISGRPVYPGLREKGAETPRGSPRSSPLKPHGVMATGGCPGKAFRAPTGWPRFVRYCAGSSVLPLPFFGTGHTLIKESARSALIFVKCAGWDGCTRGFNG